MELSLPVKTELFDGPLGLLVFLLKREDIPIRELNITDITGQYLAYLNQMKEMNFDLAGDYLYLTSILLLLKSRAVAKENFLDSDQETGEGDILADITTPAQLIRRLELLQLFQKLGQKLWQRPKQNHQIFTRSRTSPHDLHTPLLQQATTEKLTMAMIRCIEAEKRRYTKVEKDKFTLEDKMEFLQSYLREGQIVKFTDLLQLHRGEVLGNTIITLIALLELARLKFVLIFQNEHCGEILLKIIRPLDNFNFEVTSSLNLETRGERRLH